MTPLRKEMRQRGCARSPHTRLSGGQARGRNRPRDEGTILLVVIVLSLILALWLGVLAVRVREAAWTTAGLQARLQAQNAAENCVAYARAILAATEPNELLRGPDGVFDCPDQPELRNPVPLVALYGESGTGEATCDDGLVTALGESPADRAVHQTDGAVFYLRFSNDPDEGGWEDHDGVLLARCFGVAGRPGEPEDGERSAVAMIEVRLRKETPEPGQATSAVRVEYWRPLFPEMH